MLSALRTVAHMPTALGPCSDLLDEYVLHHSDAAFRQIVEHHAAMLQSICTRRIGDKHLAEDATQIVFMLLSMKAPGLSSDHLTAWLIKTAQFVSSELRRKRLTQDRLDNVMPQLSELAEGNVEEARELTETMFRGLAEIDPRSRAIIQMRYLDGIAIPQIALLLGISADAARQRLSRAIRDLRSSPSVQAVTLGAPAEALNHS